MGSDIIWRDQQVHLHHMAALHHLTVRVTLRQVEARGNALERLREDNEGLTADYNSLRERFGAKEAEARAAAAAVRDIEKQLRAAKSSAGSHRPDPQVTTSMQRLKLKVEESKQDDQHSLAMPLRMLVAWGGA